jgi:hypothetical protein
MTRSPKLSDERIEAILEILDRWSGKLTWEKLIDVIEQKLMCRYTRQALDGHERVALSFRLAKKRIRGETGRPPVEDPALQKAYERIAGLEAKLDRVLGENEQLISKFIRWAYNAHLKGMTERQLDQPLPQRGGRRGTNARIHAERSR